MGTDQLQTGAVCRGCNFPWFCHMHPVDMTNCRKLGFSITQQTCLFIYFQGDSAVFQQRNAKLLNQITHSRWNELFLNQCIVRTRADPPPWDWGSAWPHFALSLHTILVQ